MRYSVIRKSVLSEAELTVESADRALMPITIVVRADTWSESVHRTKVRLDVMLGLGLTLRVHQQPNLQRGTDSMP